MTRLNDWILDIKNWMVQLQLNEGKTGVILFGPPKQTELLRGNLDPLIPFTKTQVKNLGVLFDTELKFDKQINAVVKWSFFQFITVSKFKSFLMESDFEKVIHAFISNRLDYCNALYTGVREFSLSRLQLFQNAAARLLTGTRKREHITPILAALHWLPVKYRIQYKVALTVLVCLFLGYGNSLPNELTTITSVTGFKSSLKMHLYRLHLTVTDYVILDRLSFSL